MTAPRGRPWGGRGCGQRGLGRARKLAARLARTQDVEAEFLSSEMLVHLCRASSTLLLPSQQPSIGVLWTAALELVTSSPLARVHSTFPGAPPLTVPPPTSLPGPAAGAVVPGRPLPPPHSYDGQPTFHPAGRYAVGFGALGQLPRRRGCYRPKSRLQCSHSRRRRLLAVLAKLLCPCQ